MTRAPTMNIGIYVTTLQPGSPSQARLQEAIFAGLERFGAGRYRFIVFSHDAGAVPLPGGFRHEPLARRGPAQESARVACATLAKALSWLWRLTGASGGRMSERLACWARLEPAHFKQLRDLDIRLLWNMHQHELKAPVPYIRTIWEANHRIHSMFPEYAYARFGFDALDAGMTDSLAKAAYVITGTEEGKREIIDMLGVYPGKVRVIPFPTPTFDQHAAESPPPEFPYIFYPARFWPHKNHVVILEALAILRRSHGLDLRCVFTGSDEGNLPYVLEYARRLGIADLLDYRGVVPEAELVALYRQATALTFASAVGPDNLPPLEAMALGCPVIAADVPGAREQYGDAALFFEPTDEQGLAEKILEVLSGKGVRQRMIEKGRLRAADNTVDDYVRKLVAVFDEFARVARAWPRCDSAYT